MASFLGQDEADAIPAAPSGFVGTYDVHSIVGVRNVFPRGSQVMSLAWDPSLDEWFLVRFNSDTETVTGKMRTLGVAHDIGCLLREYNPLRFSKGQPPFQILVHSDDSPGSHCLKHGECPPELFAAPVLNVGTELRDKNIMPNFVDLPMTPLLECMTYRHFGEPDCPLFQNLTEASEAQGCGNYCPMHFSPDLGWDDLEDRIIWRGSNLRMASEIPGGMSRTQSNGAMFTAIRELEEEGGQEKVTALRLLQKVVESRKAGRRITPRLKATLMSAAAREVRAREAEQAAEQAAEQVAEVGDADTPETLSAETETPSAETNSTLDAASLLAAENRLVELGASLRSFDFDALFTPKDSDTWDCGELYDTLSKHGVDIFTQERLDADQMSRFRYHIDLGGAGGTTWSGMFSKLAMPGLLFHHETATTDFFVGNELRPWWHYVPVEQDLSDLPEKLEWARKHPVEAKQIARQGSEFMMSLRDDPLVSEALLETYVRDRTTDLVNQYVHPTGPDGQWMSLQDAFYAAGVTPEQLTIIPLGGDTADRGSRRSAGESAETVDESGGAADTSK